MRSPTLDNLLFQTSFFTSKLTQTSLVSVANSHMSILHLIHVREHILVLSAIMISWNTELSNLSSKLKPRKENEKKINDQVKAIEVNVGPHIHCADAWSLLRSKTVLYVILNLKYLHDFIRKCYIVGFQH